MYIDDHGDEPGLEQLAIRYCTHVLSHVCEQLDDEGGQDLAASIVSMR